VAELKVNEAIEAHVEMAKHWKLPDALVGGTQAMRDGASDWLPQEPGEGSPAWEIRVGRTTLFNAYADTLGNTSNRPFADSVALSDDAPEELHDFVERVDESGRNLTEFSRVAFRDAVHRGLCGILVDYPPAPLDLTLAQERELGLRPFWTHIQFSRVIGWRVERFRGEDVLTQLRITEDAVVPDGEYGEKKVERVKVYERELPQELVGDDGAGTGEWTDGNTWWVLWELSDEDNDWHPVDSGRITINRIPFVVVYTNRTGHMTAAPALEDLAWKNLEHFQSSSDQRHILRFARAPLLFGAGFRDEELGSKVEIGASRMLKSKNENAKLNYVEHSGKAIEAGQKDLESLKEEMVVLGMKPLLLKRVGPQQTATASAIEEAEEQSELQAWVREYERALEKALAITLEWLGRDAKAVEGSVTAVSISDRFTAIMDEAQFNTLLELRKLGDLSRETLYAELKKRGFLDDAFDPEIEAIRLELEAADARLDMEGAGEEEADDADDDDDDADEG